MRGTISVGNAPTYRNAREASFRLFAARYIENNFRLFVKTRLHSPIAATKGTLFQLPLAILLAISKLRLRDKLLVPTCPPRCTCSCTAKDPRRRRSQDLRCKLLSVNDAEIARSFVVSRTFYLSGPYPICCTIEIRFHRVLRFTRTYVHI